MQKFEVGDYVRLNVDVTKTTTIENISTTTYLFEGAKGYIVLALGNGTYNVAFDDNVINVSEKHLEYINDRCTLSDKQIGFLLGLLVGGYTEVSNEDGIMRYWKDEWYSVINMIYKVDIPIKDGEKIRIEELLNGT